MYLCVCSNLHSYVGLPFEAWEWQASFVVGPVVKGRNGGLRAVEDQPFFILFLDSFRRCGYCTAYGDTEVLQFLLSCYLPVVDGYGRNV